MEKGIAAKAGGVDAWTGAFDQSTYQHVFDDRDLTDYAHGCSCTPNTEWGYLAERNAYLYLVEIRPGTIMRPRSAVGAGWNRTEPGDDEAIKYRRYQIKAQSPDGNSTQYVANGRLNSPSS
jgi:hypothetical protein